jgi:hypothetical protein
MPRVAPIFFALAVPAWLGATEPVLTTFNREIQPLLENHCYECHGEGKSKGGITLDGFETEAQLRDHKLWLRVLKNTRSHIMPPADVDSLEESDIEKLATWIKRDAFQLDPANPDPGRITVRRLNRVEYRNTVRDLIGVNFDTLAEFPADDTGHGFDNISDVLTISPMLLEKYLDAAQTIVMSAVPTQPRVVAEQVALGRKFVTTKIESPATLVADGGPVGGEPARPAAAAQGSTEAGSPVAAPGAIFLRPAPTPEGNALDLSYYTPVIVESVQQVAHDGRYQVIADLGAVERYVDDQFDYNRCRMIFSIDGEPVVDQEFVREGENKTYKFTFDRQWKAGEHKLTFEIRPIGPDRDQKRLLRLRLRQVTVRGPFDEKHWVQPKDYARFFPKPVPATAAAREQYARELLTSFVTRAFRRPADEATVARLVKMAQTVAAKPEGTFEAGVAQAMVAVLASPRFIFREEETLGLQPGQAHPLVDEYALASRLSYFVWSSMPDAELFRLAGEGQLRANLTAQLNRLLADPKSEEFIRNFTGQWLQARDIANVQINSFDVFLREHPDPELTAAIDTFRKLQRVPEEKRTPAEQKELQAARTAFRKSRNTPRPELTGSLRRAMEKESEMSFAHVIRKDRSLLELIDARYTFLNEELAKHYGIDGVTGKEMRLVELPPDSPRGGVLTQGTVLAVTSNPTRTSPVKRGVFILNSILGTPPAPPPPNIPALEDVASKEELAKMSLRETLDLHAKNPMCRSCHNRMDPLGLALENFNALGQWRVAEMNQPVEAAGELITGEKFASIQELKRVLVTSHRRDYYYCMADKLLTYALGRGLDYTDTDTLDQLVAKLEAAEGRPSVLIQGIVESVPFQQRRAERAVQTASETAAPALPNG